MWKGKKTQLQQLPTADPVLALPPIPNPMLQLWTLPESPARHRSLDIDLLRLLPQQTLPALVAGGRSTWAS